MEDAARRITDLEAIMMVLFREVTLTLRHEGDIFIVRAGWNRADFLTCTIEDDGEDTLRRERALAFGPQGAVVVEEEVRQEPFWFEGVG